MLFCVGSAAFSLAGEEPVPFAPVPEEHNSGNWCETYKGIGKLYSNPEGQFIQELKVFSRLQYQYAYVDGTANGNDDFNYETDEFRRMYAGGSVKFLQHFLLSGQANYFDDDKAKGGDSRGFEFQHMWDLYLKFDAKKAFGLDGFEALQVGYGAREVNVSAEWNVSSKNIKTVERSAISNKIWAYDEEFSNPTGIWVEGQNGKLNWTLGAFSTTQDDWLADWDDGELYYLKFLYDFAEATGADVSQVLWTFITQDVEKGDQTLAGGVEWATSLSLRYGRGPWELLVEGIYGDNGDQYDGMGRHIDNQEGDFWGVVILPTYWIVKDRFEAVARYQYEGSKEDQGIRLYSRYVRRADVDSDLVLPNSGRGDEHHSIYAGLNYYFCGDNAKVMAGVQYDDISSSGDDVYDGFTTFLAFRTFF
jgi:hypothetical protein